MKTECPAIILVADTREQTPLPFSNLPTIPGTLLTGDYSIRGLEHLFSVERKTIDDLVHSVIQQRERFEKEFHRLRGFQFARLLIIGSEQQIEQGYYRSQANPKAVLHSLHALEVRYSVPVVFSPTPESAALLVERWGYWFAREIFKNATALNRERTIAPLYHTILYHALKAPACAMHIFHCHTPPCSSVFLACCRIDRQGDFTIDQGADMDDFFSIDGRLNRGAYFLQNMGISATITVGVIAASYYLNDPGNPYMGVMPGGLFVSGHLVDRGDLHAGAGCRATASGWPCMLFMASVFPSVFWRVCFLYAFHTFKAVKSKRKV